MKRIFLIILITIFTTFLNITNASEDSDGDGFTDDIDQEINTNLNKIDYVCTNRDINNKMYGCNTSYGIGVYSPDKETSLNSISEGIGYQNSTPNDDNLRNNANNGKNGITKTKLTNLKSDKDIGVATGKEGVDGIFNFLLKAAKDLKSIVYLIAGIYFLILVMRLLFNDKAEEEIGNFKKGLVWITLGLVIMQIAYGFTDVLYDNDVDANLAEQFRSYILTPLTNMMGSLASIFFLGMAIFAFYRLVTSNGDEEKAKTGKITILHSIIGFMVIKLSNILVESSYGAIDCGGNIISTTCTRQENLSGITLTIVDIINWVNSFIGIITIILIIYTGARILLSSGDEEVLKKSKQSILFIAIGLFILVTNYIILTFFILPETTI